MLSVTLAAIAGVICETEHRRREIGLFMMPKAIAAVYAALISRGLIPETKNVETVVLVVSIGLIGMASNQTGRKEGIKPIFNKLLSLLWD